MKIGILTLPLHTNYGGILQAYALHIVLQRMGHDVCVIDYDSMKPLRLPLLKMPLAYGKRIVKNLIGRRTPVFYEGKYNRETPVVRQHTNVFIENKIRRMLITDFSQIHEDDFDGFLVGSDQVWRPCYFEPMFQSDISNAYLGFAKDWIVKRVSYAASFGVDFWEYSDQQTHRCRNLLKLFDGVSVRESSAVNLCKERLDVSAQHVLDPTMLLDSDDYLSVIDMESVHVSEGELLTYVLDDSPEKSKLVESLSRLTSLHPFSVMPRSYDINSSVEDRICPSVESWLRGFYDAKLVVTDSFHACVFSILFKKPFVVVVNKERGASRFYSLLTMFGLEDRIIHSTDDLKGHDYMKPLPGSVYDRLNEMRNKSLSFLKDSFA